MISLDFTIGLGSGLAVAGLLYLALWWWARRTILAMSAKGLPNDIPSEAQEGRSGDRSPPPAPSAAARSSGSLEPAPVPGATAENPGGDSVGKVNDRRIDGTVEPIGRPAATEDIRLSQRVILHVYAQGILPAGAVAPPGLCQTGIGAALGVTQSGLVAALRRLEAAGILTSERGHVQGRDRRLKVYRLSSRGLELAHELRARKARRTATSRAVVPPQAVPSRPRGVPPEIGIVGSQPHLE